MNCQNHHLALDLVHLLKQYNESESVDALLLSIWKIFHYSLIKQAVFENVQETENIMPLKILKSCTTHWLTHGETSICVIPRFRPLAAAIDAIYKDKKDLEAKGIRDILLTLDIILMLLLLAEVLVPINTFCKFLQTRNLNLSLAMTNTNELCPNWNQLKPNCRITARSIPIWSISNSQVSILSTLKKPCPLQGNFDHGTQNLHPSIEKLISSLEVRVSEWSWILSLKSQTWWRKCHQCCQHSICSIQTQSAKIATLIEFEEFMEELDGAVTSLNEKWKKNVNQLVTMQKLKSSEVNNYL